MPPSFSFIYYFLGKICYPNKSHIPWKYSLQVSSFFIVSYFQYSWQSSGYEAHSVGWAWSRIVIMQADPCFKLSSHSKYPSLPYCTVWQYGLWSFQTGGTKLERFLPKINILKGNYWILRIGLVGRCQKLDIILVSKVI